MKTLFDILKIILPTTITSICTFLITKYTYNKNKPLDKLEIAYNRIYYPLYKLIKNKNINNNINLIIDTSKLYFNKYDKYVDRTTLRAFEFLCQCDTDTKKKEAFKNYKNNIIDKNFYLRRRLGYLESSFLQMYTYSSKKDKSTFRILIELTCLYIMMIIYSELNEKWQMRLISIIIILFFIVFIEIIYKFIYFFYYKFKK